MEQTTTEQNEDWVRRFPQHQKETTMMDKVRVIARMRELLEKIDTRDRPTEEEFQRALDEYNANSPTPDDSRLEGQMIDNELDALEEALKRVLHKEEDNGHKE
jgi:hypothetical protein